MRNTAAPLSRSLSLACKILVIAFTLIWFLSYMKVMWHTQNSKSGDPVSLFMVGTEIRHVDLQLELYYSKCCYLKVKVYWEQGLCSVEYGAPKGRVLKGYHEMFSEFSPAIPKFTAGTAISWIIFGTLESQMWSLAALCLWWSARLLLRNACILLGGQAKQLALGRHYYRSWDDLRISLFGIRVDALLFLKLGFPLPFL